MSARHDIAVIGGGIAGLVAAAAFASAGHSVALLDPAPPVTDPAAAGADMRSTAFLRAGRDLFEHIGVWGALAPHATPLEALRIVDTAGTPASLRGERMFSGEQAGGEPFGWNLQNWRVRAVLLAHLEQMPNVRLMFGTALRALTPRLNEVIITPQGGPQLRARLLIGADGRGSSVRDQLGIGAKTIRYGQKSLAFVARHAVAHNNISTEIYHEGGPFTMVPLPDHDGAPASAIVWMNQGAQAQRLRTLDPAAFDAEMTARAAHLFGDMQRISPMGIFPIITQTADRLVGGRCALIAEAAHVLPPIGAQGLNSSLGDIAALLAQASRHELGSPAMMEAYERARLPDMRARARAIDLFNRVTRAPDALSQSLRLAGLRAAHDLPALRHGLIRAGLGQ